MLAAASASSAWPRYSAHDGREDRLHRIASALRALAGRSGIEVRFVAGDMVSHAPAVCLPAPRHSDPHDDLTALRGLADEAAFLLRFHHAALHTPPHADAAAQAYQALVCARVEALGVRRFGGALANIDAALASRIGRAERKAGRPGKLSLPLALRLFARERFIGACPPSAAGGAVNKGWPELARLDAQFAQLADSLEDEEAFARQASAFLHALGRFTDAEMAARDETAPPREKDLAPDDCAGSRPDPAPRTRQHDLEKAFDRAADTSSEIAGYFPAFDPEPAPPKHDPYRAYTTAFDEEIAAASLCSSDELARLRRQLDEQTAPLRGTADRLARRLQLRLQSKSLPVWKFDREEGVLDSARLGALITARGDTLPFKAEQCSEGSDTIVTLLIDNSGSMRGRSIVVAAQVAELLARALERCALKIEILGFTTRSWQGGQSRARWIAAGEPNRPGRLNDLRHIVYKAAGTPWRCARNALGAMLLDDLLKENIDGEALLWAHDRLLKRPERRKILVVISDGAPIDDSTLSANGGGYLEKHLRTVIETIEAQARVELSAVGIGHDVTRYYSRAVRIFDADELGGALMREFTALLAPGPRRQGKGRRTA